MVGGMIKRDFARAGAFDRDYFEFVANPRAVADFNEAWRSPLWETISVREKRDRKSTDVRISGAEMVAIGDDDSCDRACSGQLIERVVGDLDWIDHKNSVLGG